MSWVVEQKPPVKRQRRDAERSERDRIAEEHARLKREFELRVIAGRTPFPREAVA